MEVKRSMEVQKHLNFLKQLFQEDQMLYNRRKQMKILNVRVKQV